MIMKNYTQPSSRSSSCGVLGMLGLALALSMANTARASVALAYTNKVVDSWMTPTCWSPNTNWSTGTWRTNIANNDLRVNIGTVAGVATVTYDATMGTTTIVETNGGDRCIAIGSGSVTTAGGTLNITGGTLRCIQKTNTVGVFLSGLNTMISTNNLNINGGTLDFANGEIGVLYRGAAPAWSRLNVSAGTLIADTIAFGTFGDSSVGGRGEVNLNGGTTILRTLKFGGVAGKTDNIARTVSLNGGTLQAATNSTVLIDSTMPAFTGTASFTVTLANNPANTINIPASVSTIINASLGGTGGFTKTGAGALSLTGNNNTFTGPLVAQGGSLRLGLPCASTSLVVGSGAKFIFATTNSAWTLASAVLTNATLEFSYGNWGINSYVNANLSVGSLTVGGPITINVTGTGFPVTVLTLLSYSGGPFPSGTFVLGPLPSGMEATLVDTGSALELHITAPSIQNLVWSGGDGMWKTSGAPNWNGNTATYLEYPSGVGDIVSFDDTFPGGAVDITSAVKPTSLTVNNTTSTYEFVGTGRIAGAGTVNKQGTGSMTMSTANDFSGVATVSGGLLYVNHPQALGATIGGTVVTGPAGTVELGTNGGPAITVTDETITISGTGFGGSLGALRGSAPISGTNVWAGPVIIGANTARIGTENNGNLLVSGNITESSPNLGVILRPGPGGTLILSGTGNRWSGRTDTFSGTGGRIVLGADNAFPTNSQLNHGECTLDLDGHNQSVASLTVNGGSAPNAIILNNGAIPSTLTVNPTANSTFAGSLQDGVSTLSLVKNGTNTQTLSGYNTYTGSTIVNAGGLGITLPCSSSALTLADGTRLNVAVAASAWTLSSIVAANATWSFNYGLVGGTPTAVFTTTTLDVTGTNVVNIAGTNLTATQIPLIAYTTKSGSGSFQIGTLPAGMQATILDTGSAIVLDVTVSAQMLTWFGSSSATWNTNGTMDWNFGGAAYQEYGPTASRTGDFALFDDTASAFTVGCVHDVRPYSFTVANVLNPYVFSGPGKIGGPTALTKSGTNVLSLTSTNDYTGGTALKAGTIDFASGALGSTGTVVLAAGTTLRWGDGNSQDISSRLRLDSTGGAVTTLDVGTNQVSFSTGLSQNSSGGPITNPVTKLGSGKLTLASGTSVLGNVTRINAGTLEIASGTTLSVDGGPAIANAALVSDFSTILVNGGTVNVFDRLGIGTAGNSTGVVTMASGTINVEMGSTTSSRGLRMTGGASSSTANNSATFNLDGGSLTTARVFQGLGANNLTVFNFNGGLLRPSGNPVPATFMTGLTHAYVKSGGAIVDSGTNLITIGQSLENDGVTTTDGGLTKLGVGRLALTGVNSYTGPTVVSNGTLWVSGVLGASTVTVHSGATLGSTGTISGPVVVELGGTLEPGTDTTIGEVLTLGSTLRLEGTARLQIGAAPACDSVAGVTDISYGGTLAVTNSTGATLAPGDVFTLFSASGTKNGSFKSIQVLPESLGLTGTFDPATGQLTLANSAPPKLNYINTGSALQFSWTGNFRLQAQTNTLDVGISNNWHDYPGGGSSPVLVPMDAAHGSVFFRLVSP